MNSVVEEIFSCYKTKKFCDVELVSAKDKKRIATHRAILFGASYYFRGLFDEKYQDEYEIPDISGDLLEQIVEFCYHRLIDIDETAVHAIFNAATYLQIPQLQERCIKYYMSIIRASNCLSIGVLAEKYFLVDLMKSTTTFIFRNFKEVVKCEEFLQLGAVQLGDILKGDNLKITNEEDVFNALTKWVRFDVAVRKGYFKELLEHVRLLHLKKSFLTEEVQAAFREFDLPFDNDTVLSARKDKPTLLRRQPIPAELYMSTSSNHFFQNGEIWIQKCNLDSDVWSNVAVVHTEKRYGYASVFVDGQLFIIGGWPRQHIKVNMDSTNRVLVQRVNISTGEIEHLKPLPWPLRLMQAVYLNNEIYVFGGTDIVGVTRTAIKYNPQRDEWIELASMECARYQHTSTTLSSDKIIVMGGYGRAKNALRSVEYYDSIRDKWFSVAPMIECRKNASAGTADNFVYVLGGDSFLTAAPASIERFCIRTGAWTKMCFSLRPPSLRKFKCSFVQDWVYYFGYSGRQTNVRTFEKINLTDGEIVALRVMGGRPKRWCLPSSKNTTENIDVESEDSEESTEDEEIDDGDGIQEEEQPEDEIQEDIN